VSSLKIEVYGKITSAAVSRNRDRQLYAAMICALDDGVGQVVHTLTANNILNNTLIFFLSDNGAPFDRKFEGTTNSNLPLRGYKEDMLEGGIRIPFAVQWPARLAPNTVYSGVVSSLDIIPTVASAAGVTLPSDRVFDGMDIMPYLTRLHRPQDRNLFWRWFGLGDTGPLEAFNSILAVRSGSLKLVVERAKDTLPPALYDLSKDIGETTDLANLRPNDVATLQDFYNHWELNAVPTLWQKDSDNQMLPLVMAGDWNGYNINDTHYPWAFSEITAPDTTASVSTQVASSNRTDSAAAQQPQLAAAGTAVVPDSGSPSSTVVVPKITTTTVSRGDSLWRLSQASYGAGTRYAVIYKANKEQIRNPNLIYPGQVFVVPAK